jgi:hypothetical protein
MMARSLRNPGNMILSITLDASRLQARKALIDALFRLYELVTDETELALARRAGRASSPAPNHPGQAEAGDGAPLDSPQKPTASIDAERREQLRRQAMQLGKVRKLSVQTPKTFNRLLDRVFAEVEAGELPAAAVTGKILDLVYSESGATPDTQTAANPTPSASTSESAPISSKPEVAAAPPGQPPAASPQADSPDIPERLGTWAAQGLAASRLFKQIKQRGDLQPRIVQWKKEGHDDSEQIEQVFVDYFLQQVSRFTIDGQEFSFELPEAVGSMDCSGFEVLIEQGKEAGVYGIDHRLWGVVGTAFLFLKNAFGPLLGLNSAPRANQG